jgi:hypothetical protein
MSDAVVSGLFAVIGTALGWGLSEAGAGWRSLTERRRAEQAEATARVFDAARTAASISEGIRWLIQIDADKKAIGEGFGTKEYTVKAVELAGQVPQLHLNALAVTAKGPRSAQPKVDALVIETQRLWDDFSKARREHIAQDPDPWRSRCDHVTELTQELVRLPDNTGPQPAPRNHDETRAAS